MKGKASEAAFSSYLEVGYTDSPTGRNSDNNGDNGNKACGKASKSKNPIGNLHSSFMDMNGTAVPRKPLEANNHKKEK
ncbi:hypothetical protein FXO38_25436 [Capsicum annuum]|nr:hypothetical protein FXO38_25436 [Capsicum annuum]KAF3636236.1 hypothetical protein FXO37_25532 [Capsicum annuum]